jgi:hypothetical protein
MACTITIRNTDNWSRSFIEQQPTSINGMEPALSSANLVKQTILGAPFTWPWNRGIAQFSTSVQDNIVAVSDFGFLEGGSIQPNEDVPYAFTVKLMMELDSSAARPQYLSPFLDDNAGNITFRLMPAPDPEIVYAGTVIYQRKASLITSLGSTWAPIPDEKNYVCQWGYLALMSLIGNDARFNEYNQKFITSVLAAHGGLNDTERNLFVSNWLRVISQVQAMQRGTDERYKSREV